VNYATTDEDDLRDLVADRGLTLNDDDDRDALTARLELDDAERELDNETPAQREETYTVAELKRAVEDGVLDVDEARLIEHDRQGGPRKTALSFLDDVARLARGREEPEAEAPEEEHQAADDELTVNRPAQIDGLPGTHQPANLDDAVRFSVLPDGRRARMIVG
jgi:anti-sigma28 factor (negative regulator of flagellin synthesis)